MKKQPKESGGKAMNRFVGLIDPTGATPTVAVAGDTAGRLIYMNAERIEEWFAFNLGTGALTGTDWKALRAVTAILELYAYDGHPSLLPAFRAVVLRMQDTTREYAYHAIAMVLDWHNRAQLWAQAELPPILKPMKCKAEPRR